MKRLLLAALLVAPASFGLDVTGAVFGADGKAVEGARVTAHLPESSAARTARLLKREQRPAIATTETDAEGTFTFEKLPDTVVDLAIAAKDLAPQLLRTFPGDIPLTAMLQRAELRRGRVTALGKPVDGALVVWTGANGAEHMATTDASGSYEVPLPSAWAHEPTVLHPKFGPKIGSPRGGEHLDFELAAPGDSAPVTGTRTLEGTVTLDGKPFGGAPVVIQPHTEAYAGAIRVVADAKGAFRATNLLPLRYAVWSGEGLDPRIRPIFESGGMEPEAFNTIDLRTEEKASAVLKLQRAPMISGRVVDHESKPVAAAQVQVVPSGQPVFTFMSDLSGRTNADGRYMITAPYFEPDMRAEVVVMPRGASAVRSEAFALTENRVVDITLPQYEPIVVRVVDERGERVPNALVAFLASDDESLLRDVSMLVRPPFDARALRTSADGTTRLHLEPGSYDFAATAEGFQSLGVTERPVRRSSEVTLQLEKEQLVRGRVHREGTGVAGVRIGVIGGEMPRADRGAMTDGDGSFELRGLARGKYRVMIFKPEELISRTLDVEAPGTIDLALPPAGTLTAQVLDASTGETIRDFAWSLEPHGEGASDARVPSRATEHRPGGGSSTGAVTVRASAGRYKLTIGATGFAASESQEVILRANEETRVEVRLSRGAGLTGRVVDESGLPVHEAAVFAFGPEEQERTRVRVRPSNAQSGSDGSYTLTGLPAGDVTVTVRKEGFVPLRKVLRVDGMTPLDLTLSRGLSIEGVVTKNGRPVADATVGAMTAALGGDHQPGTTDREGRFVIRGLVAGRYTVSVFAENASKEVHDVDPTRQRRLAISLDPEPHGILFGSVRGIATSPDGKITRRVVWVQGSDGGGAEGAIDDAGNFRIEDAPTGKVFVTASIETTRSNRTSERVEVTLDAGQPVRVDLDLGGAIVVRGRVTYDGASVAGARIAFGTANNTFASTTTSADGLYEMTLPSAGVYQINAHSERLRTMHYQTAREIKADMTIDIDVRERTLGGEVVDAVTRQPVAGAIVTLVPAAGVGEMTAGETVADNQGRFTLTTAADGRYRVIVSAHGYAHVAHAVMLEGSTPARIVVEMTASEPLRLRLVDARTGTPLEGHLVIATKEGTVLPVRSTRSLDGLELRFSLAPGTYRVTATVQGYGEKTMEVTAPGVVEIGM